MKRLLLLLASAVPVTYGFVVTKKTSGTSALAAKNSDRAHIERKLDDMMDNDWRVFRAKLVAQERADQQEEKKSSKPVEKTDEKLAKQGQLGERFAEAISSIFTNHNKNKQNNNNNKDRSIFQGDSIGGLPQDLDEVEDPFVSEAELPILLKPKVTVDKHRWAHEIPHIEPGCVLIANEKLGGVFHQAVVLVVEHHENAGSTGIIINR